MTQIPVEFSGCFVNGYTLKTKFQSFWRSGFDLYEELSNSREKEIDFVR